MIPTATSPAPIAPAVAQTFFERIGNWTPVAICSLVLGIPPLTGVLDYSYWWMIAPWVPSGLFFLAMLVVIFLFGEDVVLDQIADEYPYE